MTLDEARAHIGEAVVYHYGAASQHEHGAIESVGDRFVFVLYLRDQRPKATDPADLTLLAGKVPSGD